MKLGAIYLFTAVSVSVVGGTMGLSSPAQPKRFVGFDLGYGIIVVVVSCESSRPIFSVKVDSFHPWSHVIICKKTTERQELGYQ
jgi:hypothetical protein